MIKSRATNQQGQPRFFAVSRKRLGKNGEFLGVTTISISPEYFTDYYAALPPPVVAALIREDGYVLARYPTPINNVERLSQQGPFMARLREQAMSGQVEVRSAMDDTQRSFAFRKLPRLPAYVTTGVDVADDPGGAGSTTCRAI